jgi:predicted Zn-dependent protease
MAQAVSAAPALGANLPRLGDAGGEDLSPLAEQRLGEMAMREVRRDPDYLDDPEVNDWLGQFGQRLVGSVPGGVMGQDFEFFAIRDRSLNAFALPGGFIGVGLSTIRAHKPCCACWLQK